MLAPPWSANIHVLQVEGGIVLGGERHWGQLSRGAIDIGGNCLGGGGGVIDQGGIIQGTIDPGENCNGGELSRGGIGGGQLAGGNYLAGN